MTQQYSNQGPQADFHAREASAAPAASFKRLIRTGFDVVSLIPGEGHAGNQFL